MKLEPEQLAEARAQLFADGVVPVRGVLDVAAMRLAEHAFHWSLKHPGPGARPVLGGKAGSFYQDHANSVAFAAYRPLLCMTGLADVVGDLMGSRAVWLLYEQIWLKENEATLRTPWHQDLPYLPIEGSHLVTAWISLDSVPLERSLEFVRASHLGPLYNPSAFDPDDPTAAMFETSSWPSLPDIEADRASWPILSWAVEPGDVIIFHPAVLHGGAPTGPGERRRTISLRFFGDDASCAPRPDEGLHEADRLTTDDGRCDPMVAMALRPPGTPFRHPDFPRLR